MWPTRRASLSDRAALENLCRAAVGSDDYVLEILDDLILREQTFVALDDDLIIGMTTARDLVDGSAWLHAARTRPAYRRKGVATALVQTIEGLARMKGLGALRLWTNADNNAGVGAYRKAGFKEIGRFSRFRATAERGRTPPIAHRFVLDEDVWTELQGSPILASGAGYVACDYAFLPLVRGTAHLLANRGSLVRIGEDLALVDELAFAQDVHLEITPVAGDLGRILRHGRGLAAQRGLKEVETFLPLTPGGTVAARVSGYRPVSWGQDAVLCEKLLGTSTVAPRRRRTYAEIAAEKRSGYGALSRLAPGGHGHAGPHEDRWNP